MPDVVFENTRLLIADTGKQYRKEIKNILFHHGFRNILDTDDLSVVREKIGNNEIDLLIADHIFPNDDVCEIIRETRHGDLGDNPFIVAVTMALEPEKEDISRIMNAGVDDVILKPITAGTIIKRVNFFASDRKKFVVTSDYVGPTRRASHRPGTMKIPEISVPNPVEISTREEDEVTDIKTEIQRLSGVINEQKIERHAYQITYLIDRLVPLYVDGKATADVTESLDRLQFVSEDISRRLEGTKYDHIGGLCGTILTVVKEICLNPNEPKAQNLKLLPQLSLAIKTDFHAGADSVDIARSISDSVQQRTS